MNDDVDIIEPREVDLGGGESDLVVRRTLPDRNRPTIGAWCFLDHYGPVAVGPDGEGGMNVPPHPHTGLATVSWLFAGEVQHRDSAGVVEVVHPGECNLMGAGRGIAHSETTIAGSGDTLHGIQLWLVLPQHQAIEGEPSFQHFAAPETPLPSSVGTATARVFVGHIGGVAASPVETPTPLLAAQLDLGPGAKVEIPVDPAHELGVLLDGGTLAVGEVDLASAHLLALDPGRTSLRLTAGEHGARAVLLGGEPFTEEFVMWWNFIGPDHDYVARAREEWNAEAERYGEVPGYDGEVRRLDAPPLNAHLVPRRRR